MGLYAVGICLKTLSWQALPAKADFSFCQNSWRRPAYGRMELVGWCHFQPDVKFIKENPQAARLGLWM